MIARVLCFDVRVGFCRSWTRTTTQTQSFAGQPLRCLPGLPPRSPFLVLQRSQSPGYLHDEASRPRHIRSLLAQLCMSLGCPERGSRPFKIWKVYIVTALLGKTPCISLHRGAHRSCMVIKLRRVRTKNSETKVWREHWTKHDTSNLRMIRFSCAAIGPDL